MAVPRRKTSPSRRGMRRSADAIKKPTYVEDKDSGELRRPHHLDLKTGMYKGRQVLKKKESGLGPFSGAGSIGLPDFGQPMRYDNDGGGANASPPHCPVWIS